MQKRLIYLQIVKILTKVIAELANYTDWSLQQIQEICSAAVQNSQVFWVLPDEDVYKFFSSLLEHPTVKKCNDAAIQKIQGELIRIDSEQNDNEQLDRDWLQ